MLRATWNLVHVELSVKAGQSRLCLYSERLRATGQNENPLFSATLKATFPYQLPEY